MIVDLAGGTQRPVTVGNSGRYSFYQPPAATSACEGDVVVQVAELIDGAWHGTPARYSADTIAFHDPLTRLSIDFGAAWHLPDEDLAGFVAFARSGPDL